MITPHHDATGKRGEKRVDAQLRAFGSHAVIDIGEIGQPCAEHFADGLVTEADAEDGFAAGIGTDDVQQQSRF